MPRLYQAFDRIAWTEQCGKDMAGLYVIGHAGKIDVWINQDKRPSNLAEGRPIK
jgi:hypothetical protein